MTINDDTQTKMMIITTMPGVGPNPLLIAQDKRVATQIFVLISP